jgi:hypothetical protein
VTDEARTDETTEKGVPMTEAVQVTEVVEPTAPDHEDLDRDGVDVEPGRSVAMKMGIDHGKLGKLGTNGTTTYWFVCPTTSPERPNSLRRPRVARSW